MQRPLAGIAVDSHHDAWLNIWTSDVTMRYDPAANKWTTYDLPTRGTDARYISLLEKNDNMEVVVPYSRDSKVAVMVPQRGRPRGAQTASRAVKDQAPIRQKPSLAPLPLFALAFNHVQS